MQNKDEKLSSPFLHTLVDLNGKMQEGRRESDGRQGGKWTKVFDFKLKIYFSLSWKGEKDQCERGKIKPN